MATRKEIEVKVLGIDKAAVERTLKALGAKRIFDGQVVSAMHATRPFLAKGITLRVRTEGTKGVVTLKRTVKDPRAKVRMEYETEVQDPKTMGRVFEQLGFPVEYKTSKRRISYRLPGAHVELDRYTGAHAHIPWFLEIEAKDKRTMFKVAKALGFKRDQCMPYTFQDLQKHYKRKPKTAK